MESIYEIIGQITPPDEAARAAARRQWDSLAKPLGSLGVFEDMVVKLAGLRGDAAVRVSDRRLLVFCADNGVVCRGVTQCGSEVTAKVAVALAEKRSSVSPMARLANCRVLPVDMGMLDFPGHPGVLNRRVRNGTGDISVGPAMGREECLAAMRAGAKLAMENAADGSLEGFSYDEICQGADWHGRDKGNFIFALMEAGFLDVDNRIHDWDDYAGNLLSRREKDRLRKRAERRRAKEQNEALAETEEELFPDLSYGHPLL